MKVEQTQITPALATTLLQGNTENRTLSQRRVAAYAADMAAGAWHFDGAPIRLAESGRLLDGQHRLAAVVRSGMTLPMIVISGLDDDVQLTMDTGRLRSFADYLAIKGHANAIILSAAVNLLWKYENDAIDYRADWTKRPVVTHSLLLELFAKRETELELAVIQARSASRYVRCSRAVLCVGYVIFSDISSEDADGFYAQLAHKEPEGTAVAVYRRTMNGRQTAQQAKGLMTQTWQIAFLIKAWNAYREGREIAFLRWAQGGANREAFPVPV